MWPLERETWKSLIRRSEAHGSLTPGQKKMPERWGLSLREAFGSGGGFEGSSASSGGGDAPFASMSVFELCYLYRGRPEDRMAFSESRAE